MSLDPSFCQSLLPRFSVVLPQAKMFPIIIYKMLMPHQTPKFGSVSFGDIRESAGNASAILALV
jgi:hypothetical protein